MAEDIFNKTDELDAPARRASRIVTSYPAWLTATAYALRDVVLQGGKYYVCISAHTSGTFATDLGNNLWAIYNGFRASDTEELPKVPKRIFVGGAGNVVINAIDVKTGVGEDVVYAANAGTYLNVRAQYVRLTGTTATGLIAEY